MAFKALPQPKRGSRIAAPSNEVYVGVFKAAGQSVNTSISIPRSVFRDAGLPDYPGASFDILIGEGADRGSIAIIEGSRFRAQKVGQSATPHRLTVCSALLGAAAAKSQAASYEVGRKQIIVHMPAGFVWRDLSDREATTPRVMELGAAA